MAAGLEPLHLVANGAYSHLSSPGALATALAASSTILLCIACGLSRQTSANFHVADSKRLGVPRRIRRTASPAAAFPPLPSPRRGIRRARGGASCPSTTAC